MRQTVLVSALAEYVLEAFTSSFEKKGWLSWNGAYLEFTDAGMKARDTGEFQATVTGNACLQLDGVSPISLALVAIRIERHGITDAA